MVVGDVLEEGRIVVVDDERVTRLSGLSEPEDEPHTAAQRRRPPFTTRQLARLDEALTMSSWETGLYFSIYVGPLEDPTREHAERLHEKLGDQAPDAVLLAVSPDQCILEIVTGVNAKRRLPDRACALAVLSMTGSFSTGDLVGGIVQGLRMLSDQAGRRR